MDTDNKVTQPERPGITGTLSGKMRGEPVMTAAGDTNMAAGKQRDIYPFFKRVLDVIGSVLALVVLSPVFLIVAILIKHEDGGPVVYKHKRVGFQGKEIYIYKFRSMRENADKLEEMLTPEQLEQYNKEFTLADDPRITKIGALLRRTCLDELPQFLNILEGELSLVGPRPVVEQELMTYYLGAERTRFLSVKPGVTGYWKAYARKDALYGNGERQKMELYYVENRSIILDIKILFSTVGAVVRRIMAK